MLETGKNVRLFGPYFLEMGAGSASLDPPQNVVALT